MVAAQNSQASSATVEVVVGWLPYGVGVLLSVAALLAGLQLLLTALRPGQRSPGDRLQRLALLPLVVIVPVATLGFSRTVWHERAVVRVAEVVVGVGLLAVLLWSAWASRAAAPATGPSHPPGAPSGKGPLGQGGPVQVGLVVLLVAWTGVALILHGFGLIEGTLS
jgi:hypothetical protein